MLQFSAKNLAFVTMHLAEMAEVMSKIEAKTQNRRDGLRLMKKGLQLIAKELAGVGCSLTEKSAMRFGSQIGELTNQEIKLRAAELNGQIRDELAEHLFFWIPKERAGWYSRLGDEILGEECLCRFSKSEVGKESERAARCYAFGEWTACGFHMIRIGDAGVRAFSKAIGYTGTFSWGNIYTGFIQQRENKKTRGAHWSGNEDFFESAALAFRDIKSYRDEIAHFKTTYEDKDAERMMLSIPAFMRLVASRIDEDGNIHPVESISPD